MICIRDCLYIGGIIVSVVQDLLVGRHQLWMFLAELFLKIVIYVFHRTAENKTCHPEGEHILAPAYAFVVKSAVLEAFKGKGGYRGRDYGPVLYTKLRYRILFEAGLRKSRSVECILIDEYHRSPF